MSILKYIEKFDIACALLCVHILGILFFPFNVNKKGSDVLSPTVPNVLGGNKHRPFNQRKNCSVYPIIIHMGKLYK
jgi:hypothetical protein